MKRLTLTLVFVLVSLQGRTQVSDYDTIVVYTPEQLNNCPMYLDTSYSRHIMTGDFSIYSYFKHFCDSVPWNVTVPTPLGSLFNNDYGIDEFAQPIHFNTPMKIVGIKIKIEGDGGNHYNLKVHVRDSAFNELTYSYVNLGWTTYNPETGETDTILDEYGYRKFYFAEHLDVQDFYLGVDVISNKRGSVLLNATLSVNPDISECLMSGLKNNLHRFVDTIFVGYYPIPEYSNITDTLICCNTTTTDDMPWFKKNEQWTRFDEDSLYSFFQTTFLEFLPLIKIPKNSMTEAELDKSCNIFPNPVKDHLKVISSVKVKTIEIYNNLGMKVLEQTINNHEATLKIADLPSGNYIVKLHTSQGTSTKKFVVK
jgi:hypothetical protein